MKGQFDAYMNGPNWYSKNRQGFGPQIAYFLQFGLAECIPIIGRSRVLAGIISRAQAILAYPRRGFSTGRTPQYLSSDGWQQQFYTNNDLQHTAHPVFDKNGDISSPRSIAHRSTLCPCVEDTGQSRPALPHGYEH